MRFLLVLLLSGCASGDYAQCLVPVTRNAGMGVTVPDCATWQFGPSKAQTLRFERKDWRL
jgi:hypothetical protein